MDAASRRREPDAPFDDAAQALDLLQLLDLLGLLPPVQGDLAPGKLCQRLQVATQPGLGRA
jgi:hypothetical protein